MTNMENDSYLLTQQSYIKGCEASIERGIHGVAIDWLATIHFLAEAREHMPQDLVPGAWHGEKPRKYTYEYSHKYTFVCFSI